MVIVGTGTIGTKYLKSDYPIEEGIEAGTTKLRDEPHLIAEEGDLTNPLDRVE